MITVIDTFNGKINPYYISIFDWKKLDENK